MDEIIQTLSTFGLWHWLALGVLLIALEVVAPSTYLLWPGLAAIVTGLVLLLWPDMSWQVQLLLFAVLAVAASIAGRMWIKSRGGIETDRPQLNMRASQYVGRRATVADSFTNGRGSITLDDTRWGARTKDGSNPTRGIEVEVVEADGTELTVQIAR